MPNLSTDEGFLHRALELARAGIALSSPNPCVGAVIVDDRGNIVGSGTHTYDGLRHAEVLALEQAGDKARAATLYLNLEPCSQQGRTAPCAEAVVAAGIRRVVAAMQDPNPAVTGKGFARLRAAGIEVEVGLCGTEAKKLNEAFAKYIRHQTPLVILKAALTLDGKIAPPPGKSGNATSGAGGITGEAARAHVQELRHECDAILVGVGTVLADDPLLTDRTGRPRRRPLLRVILDSRLRLPLDSRVVKSANHDLVVFCAFADPKNRPQLEARGVRVEQLPELAPDARPDMLRVVEQLGKQQITSLLIEGGATVNGAALAAGVVDKVFLYYAPKILAGRGSVPFATGAGLSTMGAAVQVKTMQLHRFGADFAVEGYVRDPYQE
jgi:diaminohydroxyphosphoribosylaminopyrimidine deaminase/5-amino-6-(5-phosphoribosylamino)uracil reductase